MVFKLRVTQYASELGSDAPTFAFLKGEGPEAVTENHRFLGTVFYWMISSIMGTPINSYYNYFQILSIVSSYERLLATIGSD